MREENFRGIFDAFHTPCLILEPDPPRYTIVEVNKAYTDALHMERESLVNHTLFHAFPNPEKHDWSGWDELIQSLDHVIRNKETHHMSIQKYDVPDGDNGGLEKKYWNPMNIPVLDNSGQVCLIMHIVMDVTDMLLLKESEKRERRTQKKLERANRRLSNILESIADGFYALNKNWTVTYWNKKAEEFLGKSRNDILGRNLWEVYPPDSHPALSKLYSEYQKVINQQASSSFQIFYKAWYDVTVYPSEEGISVYFKDITEQKNTEKEKNNALHLLHNRIAEQTCLYKIASLQERDLTIPELLSEAVQHIPLGWLQPELIGAEITYNGSRFQTTNYKHSEWILGAGKKTRRGPLDINVVYTNNENTYTHSPFHQEEQRLLNSIVHNLHSKIENIASREELKESRRDKEELIQELTHNNNDLRQFSYITSHNLRSPITNQESLIYLLDQIPIENGELQEILDDIKESTRVLRETVDDLTEILIIKNNPSVRQESLEFSEVLDTVLHQTQYLVSRHQPHITTSFENAPTVSFNRPYLECIFLNLLSNALKFQSPDKKLEIHVATRIEDNRVVLEFQDNGIGLNVSLHKNSLFGLYQKFHAHTDSKGLGLYLVKSQVETLGGTIEAISNVDEGMTIRIRFRKDSADGISHYVNHPPAP